MQQIVSYKKFILIIVCVLTSLKGLPQNITEFKPGDYNLDSLKNIYGRRKIFIPGLELQSLITLSFYPELKDSRITFKYVNRNVTAKTTFSLFSLFNTGDKHFIIYINQRKSVTGFVLADVPFNGQVGAIGHELAHAADFKNKSLFGIAWWGIKYCNRKRQARIERAIDLSTIEHGLGSQLYSFGRFINDNEFISQHYRSFRMKYYLNTEDILDRISIMNDRLQ